MRPVTLFMLSFILVSLVWTCVKDAEAQKKKCILKSSEFHQGTLCGKSGASDCILKSKQVPKPFKCQCGDIAGPDFDLSSRKSHTCYCDRVC
ncbi:hypothetical protein Bca101_080826 [Brassica carinata]